MRASSRLGLALAALVTTPTWAADDQVIDEVHHDCSLHRELLRRHEALARGLVAGAAGRRLRRRAHRDPQGSGCRLYGNTPPGGLVNVVSKRPSNDAATYLQGSIGNVDSRELSLDSTGAIGNSDLSYRFVGVARERDGQAVTTREERYVVAPSLRWDFTDQTALTLTGLPGRPLPTSTSRRRRSTRACTAR